MSVIAVHTAWRAESLYIIYSSGSSSDPIVIESCDLIETHLDNSTI